MLPSLRSTLLLGLCLACAACAGSEETPQTYTPELAARTAWTALNERGQAIHGFAEDLEGGLAFAYGDDGYTFSGPMRFSQIGNLSMRFRGNWEGSDIVGDLIVSTDFDGSSVENMVSRCWYSYNAGAGGFTGACKQRLPLHVQFGMDIVPR